MFAVQAMTTTTTTTTTFLLLVAITCVTSRIVESKDSNETDEFTNNWRVVSIADVEKDPFESLTENYQNESENNSRSGLMFNMSIFAAVSICLILLICCCFCCTRFVVQYDEFRKSRYYELSRKQRAAEIARSLKLNEPPPMMSEKCDYMKK